MPERPSKRLPRDVNARAHANGDMAISKAAPEPHQADDGKNPAAVAPGRLGGLKRGKARAAKLSMAKRSAIAKKPAEAPWGDRRDAT